MTKTSKITIFISSFITMAALIFAVAVFFNTNRVVDNYKQQLNYSYENNFYSLVDSVNNIENDLSKLNVSSDNTMKKRYLTEIVSLCQSAQNSLASLPIEHNSISNTYKFVNQLGGYCFSLNEKLSKGQKITLDDESQLDSLTESSKEVKNDLNRLALLINSGYSIVDNIKDPQNNQNNFSGEWNGMYDEIMSYPSLIYDGPFSDSVQNKDVIGLSNKKVTETEATLIIKELFDDWEINFSGETIGGDFDTFNFNLEKGQAKGYAQITKNGGMLLQFGTDLFAETGGKTTKECEILAQKFAEKTGITSSEVVWSAESDGFVYCNLCYVQDGVIIYPDMIKIKVRTNDGQIVGWEARSWAFNHRERNNLVPKFSVTQTEEKIDGFMEIQTKKLCVIPGEYVGENLAWEFKCFFNGSIYFIYIDANTLEELNIMKVIETTDGNLLM